MREVEQVADQLRKDLTTTNDVGITTVYSAIGLDLGGM